MTDNDVSMPRLDGRSTFLLSQLGYVAAERFATLLEPLGLRPRHFAVLSIVSSAGGQTQQQIAEAMGIHRNVMVGLVDELEDRELVERRRHPSDRRAYSLYLRPGAREILLEAAKLADEQDAEMTKALNDEEKLQLRSLLRRVSQSNDLTPGVHPGLEMNSRGARS